MIHGRKQLLRSHKKILKRIAENSIGHEQTLAELRALGFTAAEAKEQLRETLDATKPWKARTSEHFDLDTAAFHKSDDDGRLIVMVNSSDYAKIMSGYVHREDVAALIQWLRNNFEEAGR